MNCTDEIALLGKKDLKSLFSERQFPLFFRKRMMLLNRLIRATGKVPSSTKVMIHDMELRISSASRQAQKGGQDDEDLAFGGSDGVKNLLQQFLDQVKKDGNKNADKSSRQSFAKLPVMPLKEFDGSLLNFYDWQVQARTSFGQAKFLDVLEDASYAKKHKSKNQHVFHMLEGALLKGKCGHLVSQFSQSRDGHALWKALNQWFLDLPGQKQAISRILK